MLGRVGLNPEKENLVRTLAQMYAPVFGEWARPMFLIGAFCVLYSNLHYVDLSFFKGGGEKVREVLLMDRGVNVSPR